MLHPYDIWLPLCHIYNHLIFSIMAAATISLILFMMLSMLSMLRILGVMLRSVGGCTSTERSSRQGQTTFHFGLEVGMNGFHAY